MQTRYYDVHCDFKDGTGYSIPLMIETVNNLTDDEVISFCKENNLFTDKGDVFFVDSVTEIDEEDYQDLKGC